MKTIEIDECIRRIRSYAMQFEAEGKKNISEDLWVAVDYLKRLQEQPKTDWIPCEERLPSEATTYLVTEEVIICSQKQYVVDVRLFGTENEWLCPSNRKITAWQPLPQPYKKEGAE